METVTQLQVSSFYEDIARLRIALTSLIEDAYGEIDSCPTYMLASVIASLFGPAYVPYTGHAHTLLAAGLHGNEVEFKYRALEHSWIVHPETSSILDVRHPCSSICALTVFNIIKPVYVGTPLVNYPTSPQMVWLKRILSARVPKKEAGLQR